MIMKLFTLFLPRLIVFALLFGLSSGRAQTVNFADSLIDYSTQWSTPNWAAFQVLGYVNTYPAYGDIITAWASSTADTQREFLELHFNNPMPVDSISIYETYNAGSIDTIYVRNPSTFLWEIVYSGTASAVAGAQIFSVSFPMTAFAVSDVRIAMNSPAVPSWNEIDAVAVINSNVVESSICSGDSIFLAGDYQTTSGVYADSNYVDSDITYYALSVLDNSSATLNVSACDSYTSPSGLYTWISSNTYMDTLSNINGCDSVLTINLTINTVDATASQTSGNTLSATASSASYQWLDCDNAFAIIPGETAQDFLPALDGTFAVEVTANGCADTSTCLPFAYWGMDENELNFISYPNPVTDNFYLEFESEQSEIIVVVSDLTGKFVSEQIYTNTSKIIIPLNGSSGSYIVQISTEEYGSETIRILKK